jgi:hypothetical protein
MHCFKSIGGILLGNPLIRKYPTGIFQESLIPTAINTNACFANGIFFYNNNRLVPTKGARSQREALDTIDPQTGSADVLPWNKFRIQQV